MYKYYLINSFCIEASNTQESLVLATEYKLVGFCFFCFFKQDFSIIYMLYIRYFCSERSAKQERKGLKKCCLDYIVLYVFPVHCFDKLLCLLYVEVISLCRYMLFK